MEPTSDTRVIAVIDLLLTIGYIDGRLHDDEQAFIHSYVDKLVEHVAPPDGLATLKAHAAEAYAKLDAEISALAAEVTAKGDAQFTSTRLKTRAVALFRAFSPSDQKVALELLDAVVHTDGTVTAEERELHDELLGYFAATPSLPEPIVEAPAEMLAIAPAQHLPVAAFSHPLLDPIEQRYAQDPAQLVAQLTSDYNLVFQAITMWERQRARGNGRLAGVADATQLVPGSHFLDGHVHVLRPDRPTELVVLGDLHGCYSCLKAALLQSEFIERAYRYQQDPANNPDIKLVLLGDYIDRGIYSFEGVLRAALQLLVALPEHVVLLRGNHEYLVRVGEYIVSSVNPAEAVPALTPLVPIDTLEAYRHLFEHMPTSFVFDRTLFVHGGIPREDTVDKMKDLASLDDSVTRFEMLWSDPVDTDRVPVELQRGTPRFGFGKEQFRTFMDRIGCQTLIRGHEQVETGFVTPFDLGHHRLHTLFSAGGRDNNDLPPESRYRGVTPMALTIRWANGTATATPWQIAYDPFDDAAHNGLYR